MDQKNLNPIALALGITGALACSSAIAADDPFSLTELSSGQMHAGSHGDEGRCGEGRCGEGKCGDDHKDKDDEKEQKDETAEEGKCGEGKCGEGKCGGTADSEGESE